MVEIKLGHSAVDHVQVNTAVLFEMVQRQLLELNMLEITIL